MPQKAIIRAATTNTGAFVQLDPSSGPADAYCVNAGAGSVHIVFGAVDAADALTIFNNGGYFIVGSGGSLPVQRINPVNTWVRSSGATSYNTNWILSW